MAGKGGPSAGNGARALLPWPCEAFGIDAAPPCPSPAEVAAAPVGIAPGRPGAWVSPGLWGGGGGVGGVFAPLLLLFPSSSPASSSGLTFGSPFIKERLRAARKGKLARLAPLPLGPPSWRGSGGQEEGYAGQEEGYRLPNPSALSLPSLPAKKLFAACTAGLAFLEKYFDLKA